MFTGIIEELGTIRSIDWHKQGARFHIQAAHVLTDVKQGDSICVNGCCLTVVSHTPTEWSCDVVEESLERTTFRHLQAGARVNLERAARYQERLGGHLVQGHVDGAGKIKQKKSLSDDSWWVEIETPAPLLRYLIEKGSIAVDGVSLTLAKIEANSFAFAMIPHTAQMTTLGYKQVGDFVNLEVDLMAKYIERFITPFNLSHLKPGIDHAKHH